MFLSSLTCLALSATLGTSSRVAMRATPSTGVDTARPATSSAAADTAQVPLTVEILGHMTTFWESFMREPLSVRDTGRKANQMPLPVVLSEVSGLGPPPQIKMTALNMVSMAEKFPSVAADLKQASLTSQQWNQFRRSLIIASTLDQLDKTAAPPGTSITISHESLGWKNAEFLRGHKTEFDALKASKMWFPPPPKLTSGGAPGNMNP